MASRHPAVYGFSLRKQSRPTNDRGAERLRELAGHEGPDTIYTRCRPNSQLLRFFLRSFSVSNRLRSRMLLGVISTSSSSSMYSRASSSVKVDGGAS